MAAAFSVPRWVRRQSDPAVGYTADNKIEPAEATVVGGIFKRFNAGESLSPWPAP